MSKNAVAILKMVRKLGAEQYLNDSGCSLECRSKEIFSPCPSMQLNWSDLPFAGSFCNHPEEDDISFLSLSLLMNTTFASIFLLTLSSALYCQRTLNPSAAFVN
jgi:hypothetical protein